MSKPITDREYATSSHKCPWCHGTNLAGGFYEGESDMVWQQIQCLDCSRIWTDEYRLTGYTVDIDDANNTEEGE